MRRRAIGVYTLGTYGILTTLSPNWKACLSPALILLGDQAVEKIVTALQSGVFYTHFSLLRSIEGGFGVPCLNHACDSTTNTMTDLFDEKDEK
jgi:hypothetical protein